MPDFAPGQFAMLYAFGVGEAPISVSGDLTCPGPLVHTIRSVGAVTAALCKLPPGQDVGVRGPFGTAWPGPRPRAATWCSWPGASASPRFAPWSTTCSRTESATGGS